MRKWSSRKRFSEGLGAATLVLAVPLFGQAAIAQEADPAQVDNAQPETHTGPLGETPSLPEEETEPETDIVPETDVAPEEGTTEPEESGAQEGVLRIVVTAEKRPEDLQDVPISITVITSEEIEDADITSFDDIARNTPNFSFFPSGDRSFSLFSVRGISNASINSSRDPVDFYIDGVPYGFAAFVDLDLPDLERVEVLRGPQNVLYGRNAIAGVVNIITRRPTNTLAFNGSASYGSFNDLDLRASVSGPLIEDELFLRLSGSYGSRDGYINNRFLSDDVDEQSDRTGRVQLLWTPTENLEIALNASFDNYRNGASAYVFPDRDGPFDTEQSIDGFSNLLSNSQSLKIAYTHPQFRATSITTRQFSFNDLAFDGDGLAADALVRVLDELSVTLFTQEIRFQSPEAATDFEWLLGAYYESSQFSTARNGFRFGGDAAATLGVPFPANTLNLANGEANSQTFALFGQVSYQPIDALTLTTGLRYESTQSTLSRFERTLDIPGFPSTSLVSLRDIEQSGNELLPRFAVEYRINPDLMVYGSITRGYRPPGVNLGPGSAATATYEAERSWSYELGLKSSWLDDLLAVNLALFYSPVDNFQVVLFDTVGGSFIDNADVRTLGLELEARATPTAGLDIIAGLGIVDAEFTNFTNPFTGVDSTGNQLTFAPNLTYNLAVQYRSPSGFFGRAELQGLGTTFFDDANLLEQAPYALFNARLGYETENLGIYLFGNNIFSTEYINQAFSFPPLGTNASYGAPATYGIQFRVGF